MTKEIIAEGKTKRVFVDDNPNYVILEAIDRLTAGDASKVAEIDSIGAEKTAQSANIFAAFEKAGIATAFVDQASPIQLRCHAVDMLPIEWVIRRYPYGSYFKRNPEAQTSGAPQPSAEVITELFHKAAIITSPLVKEPIQMSENAARDKYLKDDGWEAGVYTDPFVKNEGGIWAIYDAKKPVQGEPLMRITPELSEEDVANIWQVLLLPAFKILEDKLNAENIALVDIKFEIGIRRDNGEYVIADVVDNDSWRIWPDGDPKAQLDKQGFREGDGLDDVMKNYKIVTKITESF